MQRLNVVELSVKWHFEHKIIRDLFEKLLKPFSLDIKFTHT